MVVLKTSENMKKDFSDRNNFEVKLVCTFTITNHLRWCYSLLTVKLSRSIFSHNFSEITLRKKCPYLELFWSAFSNIFHSECGKMCTKITPNTNNFQACYFWYLQLSHPVHFEIKWVSILWINEHSSLFSCRLQAKLVSPSQEINISNLLYL